MSRFDAVSAAAGFIALVLSVGVIGYNVGISEVPDIEGAYNMCSMSRNNLRERLDSVQRKLWACERGVRLPPEAP